MEEFKIGIQGHVKITSSNGNQILLDEHNEINSSALEIITRCLSQVDFPKALNKIKAIGNFGEIEREIFFVQYNPKNNTMLFRATFLEFDFDGTITKLELRSSALKKTFASKPNINIFKDGQSRAQIDWVIQVTF